MHKIIEKVRRGSGQDDVIFCSEGGLSNNDGRGEGGKNWRFSHDVICETERPLISMLKIHKKLLSE